MDTTKLFEAALGLVAPWHVVAAEFQPGAPGTPPSRGQLELRIDFARGGMLPCPTCGVACKAYDTAPQRWRHLNFFEHETYLHARVPRVTCATHGVGTVTVPWARAGSGFTLLFEAYVLALTAAMPMAALARLLGENDTRLWRIVQWHVTDARRQVDMQAVTSVVVDETSRAKHHHYVSLFLEPKAVDACGAVTAPARVLFVTDGRSHTAFHAFVADLTAHGGAPAHITDVGMDLSPAYERGAAETLPQAAVTFDRFHVMQVVSKALDDVRRREHKTRPELKRSRYVWLTNPAHLSVAQQATLDRLSRTNLLTAQAYQMRLNLRALWERPTPGAAARYLAGWCAWVETAAARPVDPTQPWVLEAMARAAQTLRTHAAGILNYFRRHLTSGVIEAVNSLAQAARARARGYRNVETFQTILYLLAGRLRFDLPDLATHTR